jgi:hypothetical protein
MGGRILDHLWCMWVACEAMCWAVVLLLLGSLLAHVGCLM